MREKLLRLISLLAFVAILLKGNTGQAQSVRLDQQTLLDGKRKVTIPFRYVHNFIILQVKLYGVLPVNLIYDTGAEHVIIFKRQYTDILQVPYDKRIPIMGADLSRKAW